jgi:O-acetyl-ADP-ribose deacetylase (regulator of RNase III)
MIHPKYIQGDLFSSAHYQNHEPVVIAHVCNNLGMWGAGFAKTFKQRYPKAFTEFSQWFTTEKKKGSSLLGMSQLVTLVENNGASLYACNMVAQAGLYSKSNQHPLQYDSLQHCLTALERFCKHSNATVYMPKIGSGLARGDWGYICDLIVNNLSIRDIAVSIFEVD